jgi:glycine hydroxymethyltransferase
MGLALPMGGHLTHGWSVSISGKFFTSVPYGIRKDTGLLDYDEIRDLAKKERPALLWAGGSAYSRLWDFETMASIARDVGARFCADIAHIAGLVVGGVHPSPVPHADVVTTTTHKTLRGPRGGMILCRTEHAQAIDRAVFPGLQGGPHVHNTAALAVALKEAAQPSFKEYAKRVVANAAALAAELMARGFDVVSGGTDNHLILIDLTNKKVAGKIAARALDKAGIELNYNSVPYDTRKPFDPSGIRLGSPAVSSRGMGEAEMKQIAAWIDRVVSDPTDETAAKVLGEVHDLTRKFPAPGISI